MRETLTENVRMFRINALAISAIVAMGAGTGNAQEISYRVSAKELEKFCASYLKLKADEWQSASANDAFRAGKCWAFVIGAIDAISHEQTQESWLGNVCIPTDAQPEDLVERAALHVMQGTNSENYTGYALVRSAFFCRATF